MARENAINDRSRMPYNKCVMSAVIVLNFVLCLDSGRGHTSGIILSKQQLYLVDIWFFPLKSLSCSISLSAIDSWRSNFIRPFGMRGLNHHYPTIMGMNFHPALYILQYTSILSVDTVIDKTLDPGVIWFQRLYQHYSSYRLHKPVQRFCIRIKFRKDIIEMNTMQTHTWLQYISQPD